MSKKAFIALIVLVVVAGGGVLWLLRKEDGSSANTASKSTTAENAPEGNQATIIYSGSGYSPSSITVKTGDTVVIKNESSTNMQFDSDPHPAHTINTELNVGGVPPGESMSFVVERTGTFGYHNHLSPTQKGTIIVE